MIAEIVDVAESRPGGARWPIARSPTFGAVHLLMNNAGVGCGGYLWENTDKDWQWVLGVNLMGVVHGIQHFVPRMLDAKRRGEPGHIVNTASMAGWLYCAADGRLQRLQARGRRAVGDAVPRPEARAVDDRRDDAVPGIRADRNRRTRIATGRATSPTRPPRRRSQQIAQANSEKAVSQAGASARPKSRR